MRLTKSLLWLVVLGLSPFSLHAEVKYASFPALGVELPQPEGYIVSKEWLGLENPAKLVGIQISTLPASFSEASAGFTPQQMAAAHMKMQQRSDATIAGKKALLIQLTQTMQDVEVGKWIAIYGDETNTTMLVATFPPNDNELSEEVKPILTVARSIEVKRKPLGENVDFKVGETRKLRISSDSNNTLIYTLGGVQQQESPTDPLFLVAKTGDVLPPGDIRGQLQQCLQHLAETTITHYDAIQNVDLGPDCRACEKGRYVTGKLNGDAGNAGQILLAPPGFAVGGVQVGSGLWMDALRLIYMPLEGNKLQVSNRQYSEWVGGRGGGTKEIVSDGGLIVGVAGSFKENMESLQFLYVEAEALKIATSLTAESSGSSSDQALRTWKSASGKFSVSARLESVDGKEAKLVTHDGRHIFVAIEKLSDEDQKHIKESEEVESPFKIEKTAGQPSE